MKNFFQNILQHLGPEESQNAASKDFRSSRVRSFAVLYEGLEVGRLTDAPDGWEFSYSEAFKAQNRVKVITDFPSKDKSYHFHDLWPFFASRIPSIQQPEVRRRIEEEHLDVNDKAALLGRFGKRTISNPFILSEI